ncbi:uncharacterized protein LOC106178765 [Lingula anatina]|uniref:Uncharacterized protein LOC106178765 n=1 Tax=Lingula anatina TaxID=7574 RepID=A0A1S3K4H6_LINAN|nr:uncharacterized protein LOC106178765 [Lingula anatina]XP_013417537.1 uncharacterized protein LOC106178765 [Lingula anatina]XP_013417538.1 uncharacterized protein LOC106178765 [Lingula anatina]|eukprot:XP_013417536.1 uncharacterized protein LOC106178765 [Lingula anatina]
MLLNILWLVLLASGCLSLEDWLIKDINIQTTVTKTEYGTYLMSNGLISREFSLYPDFATIDFQDHHSTQSSILRAIKPEAVIMIDGIQYNIGGFLTNTPTAYLNRTALGSDMRVDPKAFHFHGTTILEPQAPYPYKPRRGAPQNIHWPPIGMRMDVEFKPPFDAPYYHQLVTVTVHYEMYDGIPLLVKWLSVSASGEAVGKVAVTILSVEYLAVNQPWAPSSMGWLLVESNEPHGTVVSWTLDPHTNDMPGSFQPNVNCSYQVYNDLDLKPSVDSFRVHELVVGSSDPERHSLSHHRMFRLLAPQTQENPIFFHMTNSSSVAVKKLIDQLSEVGFEMMIYSFGSGLNLESTNSSYIDMIANDTAYALSKGIEVGGYDLISLSRQVQADWMAIDVHGHSIGSACFASGWHDNIKTKLFSFLKRTGMSMLETDGPYGGYQCASTNHSHHDDITDSIYEQNRLQGEFYRDLRSLEVYINQPDTYFYQGGNKDGMGYNENQYSLPRWQDLSISRQGMYDDLYRLIPSAGWMFVPLVQYHAGGGPAEFEPLSKHLLEYEWAFAQYLGAGVAACYRGFELYDSYESKAIVMKWVSFYKKYRDIVTSDVVHVRRADMQSYDSFMHVNPHLKNKGLAMVFNPTFKTVVTNLKLPLYYTGLNSTALIREQEGPARKYTLDREYKVSVPLNMGPLTITWFLVQ